MRFFFSLMGVLATSAVLAQIPGTDLTVMNKFSRAKVIRYHVAGVHQARATVVHGDHEGKADVTDRVTLEFLWDVKTRKPIGEVKVTDAKSELKNVKSDGTNCPPPSLNGEYEHFQTVKHTVTPGPTIQIEGTRTFPAASVSQWPASCTMKAIPGAKENRMLMVGVIDPVMLGMPMQTGNKNMSISADRKTLTMVGAEGWVWTYTPTPQ